jgi:hypothetical protein
VLLVLTAKATRVLGELMEHHLRELAEGAPRLSVALRRALRPVVRKAAAG